VWILSGTIQYTNSKKMTWTLLQKKIGHDFQLCRGKYAHAQGGFKVFHRETKVTTERQEEVETSSLAYGNSIINHKTLQY